MPVTVLDRCLWKSGGGILPDQKLWGQVTKCELTGTGIVFYVRENLDGSVSFVMSSGQRWGEKGGNGKGTITKGRQILELSAPEQHWTWIAEVVASVDPMARPVRRNKRFTATWAEDQLKEGRRVATRNTR